MTTSLETPFQTRIELLLLQLKQINLAKIPETVAVMNAQIEMIENKLNQLEQQLCEESQPRLLEKWNIKMCFPLGGFKVNEMVVLAADLGYRTKSDAFFDAIQVKVNEKIAQATPGKL